MFAINAQRFTAGGEDCHAGRTAQQGLRQSSACLQDVLAIVEHQQRLLRPKAVAQGAGHRLSGGLFHAQYLRQCGRNQRRIAQRRQVNKPNTIAICFDHLGGGLQRQPRLPDSAGPRHTQKPCCRQALLDLDKLQLATDERLQSIRQICTLRISEHGTIRLADNFDHRAYKSITSACQCFDPVLSGRVAGKRPADCGDLGRKVVLLHHGVRPRGIHDVGFRHVLVGPRDQSTQNRNTTCAKRNRGAGLGQYAGFQVEAEWPQCIDSAHFREPEAGRTIVLALLPPRMSALGHQ